MSTAKKVCKIVHFRVVFRKNKSRGLLNSSPFTPLMSTSVIPKRPLSSVAIWRQNDDGHDHDFDNFLDNVSRNTVEEPQQRQQNYTIATISSSARPTINNNKNAVNTLTMMTSKIGSCCHNVARFPCGSNRDEDILDDLPPPLPEPKYSVHKRVLPPTLTAFSSKMGKQYLMEAFTGGTAESYWKLTEHFVNQSEPAFCGITTLLMCLNAMCIDPNIRWRGGWRFYGSEDILLNRCCFSAERIRRKGIVMEDFSRLGRCHGLIIDLKRPPLLEDELNININDHSLSGDEDQYFSIDDFRSDIRSILSDTITKHQPVLVVSFSRAALGQTGDGHFSPIAAYHKKTDQVLVLDVARFKYSPYWVSVTDLYQSMQEADSVTNKSRGWFRLVPPHNHECMHDDYGQENRMPIEFVPKIGERERCPINAIKIHFCKGNPNLKASPTKKKSSSM